MKTTKILYWVFTGLFAAAMIFTSISQVMGTKEAADIFKQMQFPEYLMRFIGIAKLLGVVAVLYPGFPRLKEWAYAGLFFDLAGVLYGSLALGTSFMSVVPPMSIFFILLFASYIFYHRKAKMSSKQTELVANPSY
jgi:hypothetical protein